MSAHIAHPGSGSRPVSVSPAVGLHPSQMPSPPSEPCDPLRELISTFNELNGSTVEEVLGEPSPLEFMRFVARNTPFVARGAAAAWKAVEEWDRGYLLRAMEGEKVNVAVTPRG